MAANTQKTDCLYALEASTGLNSPHCNKITVTCTAVKAFNDKGRKQDHRTQTQQSMHKHK